MSETRRPYSRVYWSVVDDPDFVTVYDDNHALATWLRLLLVADGTWPATAPLPRSVKDAPLKKLVTCGLVEILPGERYRVKGLDAERARRSQSASASATLRWNTPRKDGGKAASRGTRFKVLERDGFQCRYCGGKAPDVVLDVDHIVPVRDGGTDELDNLVAACVDCNAGKSGHTLRADNPVDARAPEDEMPRRDEQRQEKTSRETGANAPTNPPPVFLGFPPKKPWKPTPAEIASYRRYATTSSDPAVAANARETLEKLGIPVEESEASA